MTAPMILALGEAALTIQFGDRISDTENQRVHALDAALAAQPLVGQLETVPSYCALLVVFDPELVNLTDAHSRLLELARAISHGRRPTRRWRVPVVYGGDAGFDLDIIAAYCGLKPSEYTVRHASRPYRIHMIGFQPGFSYLGGLDPGLAMPRRAEPRLRIPPGAVTVGGEQSAIGTVETPSGWHVIGRTPVRPFQADRTPPFLFEPGDEIVFIPVAASDWLELDAKAAGGALLAELIG